MRKLRKQWGGGEKNEEEEEQSDNARRLLCTEGLSLRSEKRHRIGTLGVCKAIFPYLLILLKPALDMRIRK